jgi:hypothetical protein
MRGRAPASAKSCSEAAHHWLVAVIAMSTAGRGLLYARRIVIWAQVKLPHDIACQLIGQAEQSQSQAAVPLQSFRLGRELQVCSIARRMGTTRVSVLLSSERNTLLHGHGP